MRFNEKLPVRNRKRIPLESHDDRTASEFYSDERPPAERAGRRHNVQHVAQSFYNYPTETTRDQVDGSDDLTFYMQTLNRICVLITTICKL